MNKTILLILIFLTNNFLFSQSPDTLYPVQAFTSNGYKYGYINRDGNLVIQAKYDFAKDFSEGLAFVKSDNRSDEWLCINIFAETVFKLSANFVFDFKSDQAKVINHIDSVYFINRTGIRTDFKTPPLDFNAKKIPIPYNESGKWGYRMGPDNIILPAIYEMAGEYSEDLAPVFIKFSESDLPEVNCFNAFINLKGEVVLRTELKYNDNGYLVTGYFYSPGRWQNGVCRYYTSNDPKTRVMKYIRNDGRVIW